MYPSVQQRVPLGASTNRFMNAGAMIMNQQTPGSSMYGGSALSQFGINPDQREEGPNLENLMRMLNPPPSMKMMPPRRGNNRSVSVVPTTAFSMNSARMPTADNQQQQLDLILRGGGPPQQMYQQPYIESGMGRNPVAQDYNSNQQSSLLVEKRINPEVKKASPPKGLHIKAGMPQMGFKATSSTKGSPSRMKGKEQDLYNFQQLNQQIYEEGEDAGGAIMKKLYRIHSRYVLEVAENMNIDISGQMVDSKLNRRGQAMPLDQQRQLGQKKKNIDPNNHLLSLFLQKNQIEDFETVVENQMSRINQNGQYDELCYLLQQCFRDNLDRKIDKKKVISVSVVNLMRYHSFFSKLSSQAVRILIKNWHVIKLSQDQLLYKENDTPLGFYMVLFGKVVMHSKSLGAIGVVTLGDFIGEELMFEKQPDPKTGSLNPLSEKNQYLRQETAYSEGETYLLECYFDEWRKLKDVLILMKLRKDYLLIDNHLKKCYQQKKSWRQIKAKMTGELYSVPQKEDKSQKQTPSINKTIDEVPIIQRQTTQRSQIVEPPSRKASIRENAGPMVQEINGQLKLDVRFDDNDDGLLRHHR